MTFYNNSAVDWFFNEETQWQAGFRALRDIILEVDLEETLKWGVPCYTLNGKNVVLIHGFKTYFAILFMKGALLADPEGILIQQTENVQSSRQIRFESLEEVLLRKETIINYVKEAVQLEQAGKKVELKTVREYPVPEELNEKFEELPELKEAFEKLSGGRQRAYLLHFASAKQRKTRMSRIEKYMPQILDGKGMDD